jgi:CheY-like chemotaxis protein
MMPGAEERNGPQPLAIEGLPRQILLVDDNEPFREMLADVLAAHGCEILHASNGLEALLQVKHARPGVILLDLSMPRLDGFETLKRIRAFDPGIRVVIVTGNVDAAAHDRARAAGASAVLVKPVDLVQLVATVGGT